MYTSLQRKLVSLLGGHLFTVKVELLLRDYIDEQHAVKIELVPASDNIAILIGSFYVTRGLYDVSFKCATRGVQYCRHDPVTEAELHNPITINALITRTNPLYTWVWTSSCCTQLPARFEGIVTVAELPFYPRYRETVEELVRKLKAEAATTSQV